ncbi:MAG: hypothetical protein EAX96_15715 [Candidatus Lokiarchaeota archaeon]|nr:hypothetical protein [Candidatus Lokiarchaeota archaeon]
MVEQLKQCAKCKNFNSEKSYCIHYKMRVSRSSVFTCEGFKEIEKEEKIPLVKEVLKEKNHSIPKDVPSFSSLLSKSEDKDLLIDGETTNIAVRVESEINRFKRIHTPSSIQFPFDIEDVQALLIIKNQLTNLDLICESFDHVKLMATFSGFPKGINENLVIEVKISNKEATISAWARNIQNAIGFLTYFKIMLANVFDSISKLDDKIKKLNQIVNDTNKILKILITLFKHFEKNWQVGEIIYLLKDIRTQIEQKIPGLFVIKKLEDWILIFDKQYGDGITKIPERLIIDLEYEILDWLFEINKVAFNNLDLYLQTFPELSSQIQIQMNMMEENFPLFSEIEQRYFKDILQYLITIEKETGLTIYQENFAPATVDSHLIGGFLHAIQNFGTQMLQEASSMRRLSYQNFEILLDDELNVIVALLLKGKPSDNISKKLRIFVTEFESRFKEEFKIWNGDLKYFFPARELTMKIFNL